MTGLISRRGFTLLEILMVVSIMGILGGIAALSLNNLGGELQNGTNELSGFLRQTRAKAMATTSAYRVKYASPTKLFVQSARNCGSDSWTTDSSLKLELREQVYITNDWDSDKKVVCFSSRGIANNNETIKLTDKDGKRAEVEVLIGGALEIR